MRPRSVWAAALLLAATMLVACGDPADGTIRLYTSVTESTVTAVVDAFEAETGVEVEVFRAPTGEVAARIAAEQRSDGIQADVLWLTDPLTMYQYADDGVLRRWSPTGADAIPAEYRTERFWGTRLLSMVIVQQEGLTPVTTWTDLVDPQYRGRIAAPDPGFAGSAFAVFGYFASDPALGPRYVADLAANDLTIVNAPGEVVTGVAEGRFDAGVTLRFSAQAAVDKGSPISIVWPQPGAVTLYSPIGLVDGATAGAEQFVEYVITPGAQQRIAETGWQPILPTVPWETGGPQVSVDWGRLVGERDAILETYRTAFDG